MKFTIIMKKVNHGKLSKVYFNYLYVKPRIKHINEIKSVIKCIFKDNKLFLNSLRYVFCNDEYLKVINQKFLQHDYYTDIITFPLSNEHEPITAEIYISIDRVTENAKNYEVPIFAELARVVFHGALHLCGFEDSNDSSKANMTFRENHYLDLYYNIIKSNVSRET